MGRRGTEADGLPVRTELAMCFADIRCLREGWTSLGLLRVLFAAALSPGLGCLFVRVVTAGNS